MEGVVFTPLPCRPCHCPLLIAFTGAQIPLYSILKLGGTVLSILTSDLNDLFHQVIKGTFSASDLLDHFRE